MEVRCTGCKNNGSCFGNPDDACYLPAWGRYKPFLMKKSEYEGEVTIEKEDICGQVQCFRGKIIGERVHGYNSPGGGWALYGGDDYTPAEFVIFYPKGKRKPIFLNKKFVKIIRNVD